jgi:hypothetical protein
MISYYNYFTMNVHPFVCYFKCPSCNEVVTENDVSISADLIHDCHAVKQFTELVVDHHTSQGRKITKVHQYTDGCARQYKSRIPFLQVSQGVRGVPISRNFFGSGHGKGPADGTSAVVKQGAYNAVKSGKAVIKGPKDMYSFLKKNMTLPKQVQSEPVKGRGIAKEPACCSPHSIRNFFFVPEIQRNEKMPATQTYSGTQKLHSVRSTGREGILEVRKRPCACDSCLGITDGPCSNKDWVDEWVEVNILKQPKKGENDLEVIVKWGVFAAEHTHLPSQYN